MGTEFQVRRWEVLEMDGGDGHTILAHLMAKNHTLKNV